MIILGVDPGLTRCGVGVIEAGEHRRLSFIHVDVVRSSPDITQDLRLLAIYNGLSEKMDRFAPDAVSIERVFAQSNRNTVLGTAQAAGLAMLAAAQRNIPVALHTPTEAKLAITGNGQAQKIQVERMVTRILNLTKMPTPRRCRRRPGLGYLPRTAPSWSSAGRRARATSDRRATPMGRGRAELRAPPHEPRPRHVVYFRTVVRSLKGASV